jgi:hypothetical protein
MRRLLVILTVLIFGVSACGDDDQQSSGSSDRACPEGTPSLQASDVIGTTPKGYEVVEGDPAALERVADQMKQTMGPAFRDWDGRVLVRRGAAMGTAVLVFNAKERIPPPDELLRQQEDAEQDAGLPAEPIAVGSTDGRLHQAADGGYLAVAPAGECAMMLLVADREKWVRDTAVLVDNEGY